MSTPQHRLSKPDWLELRYRAFQREYDHMVTAAGLMPGWRVLDAGSGPGTHASALRRAVGAGGAVIACDVAGDNVDRARRRIGDGGYDDVVTADVSALPFDCGSFDAVWCANVLQYVADDRFATAVRELRRVVRPGGRVVIKDVDMTLWRMHPLDPLLMARLLQAGLDCEESRDETLASMRGRTLSSLLRHLGLPHVAQHTVLIERWAPLAADAAQVYRDWLRFIAAIAAERGASDADVSAWETAAGADARPSVVDSPDFYCCEGQVLVVAEVPGAGRSG